METTQESETFAQTGPAIQLSASATIALPEEVTVEPETVSPISDSTCAIKSFSPKGYLKDLEIADVLAIYEDKALVTVKQGIEYVYACCDIKKGKILYTIDGEPSTELFEQGYIYSISLDPTTWEVLNVTFNDIKNRPVFELEGNEHIRSISPDAKRILLYRDASNYAYSGKEYAVLDYDGNLLSDWIRPVDPNTDWSHVGDGIYYVGNTAGTDMMFNIETFEFFEVPVFESFIADDIYSEKQSATWSGLYSYADGYGINRFRTNFIDGKAYISLASTTDKSDISFFTLDIHGNAEFVGAIPDCTDLLFSEALKSYVGKVVTCIEASDSAGGSGSQNHTIATNSANPQHTMEQSFLTPCNFHEGFLLDATIRSTNRIKET